MQQRWWAVPLTVVLAVAAVVALAFALLTPPPYTDVTSPTAAAADSTVAGPAPLGANAEVLRVLEGLPVKGRAPKTGYSRAQFQTSRTADWADTDRNGCDTRNDILRRDLEPDAFAPRSKCTIATGTLADPYTGRTIQFTRGKTSAAVQIDHVVALSDAWQKGAQQLSKTERVALANDPVNLRAVDGATNASKGDSDAASWLPPRRDAWCDYVAAQVAVKAKYRLWVTEAEQARMRTVVQECPGTGLPAEAVGK